jgi:poly(A) polymerase/tRNA nucleotidyltransferase (CCA-adding enzyme)
MSNNKKQNIEIPKNVTFCLQSLSNKGYEAFIVGGCVRDYLLGSEPSDWDITTNANPEEIQEIFNQLNIKSFYENNFGTVGIIFPKKDNPEEHEIIEITTYRSESSYSDNRRPDRVEWSKTIEEDLKRRDFTINAIALSPLDDIKIIDPYNGQMDIKNKTIKAVGCAEERFTEDALRMIRAIRFKTVLEGTWTIEKETEKAIKKNAHLLKNISQERLRDELIKMIKSSDADEGIEDLRKHNLLKYIIPELEEGYGIKQNKHHIFDCYYHNLEALRYSTKKNFDSHIRIASLLHDIGKPATKQGSGENATFYNHEIIGAKMTKKILNRLHFPNKDVEKITSLVRYHLFYYNVDEVKEASIRRLIKNIGTENVEDLLKLRMADRIGSGCPKAEPYKLRHLKYMIEKVSKDPLSVKMLKINGTELMKILNLSPSPRIGWLLEILLEEVLNDPSKNEKDTLLKRLKELNKIEDKELKELYTNAKGKIEEIEESENKKTKEKFWIK